MKHLFSILTAVFAVLAFLVSCGGSEGSGDGGTGGIYGHVTDFVTGEDVAHANVQLRPGGETTLTGSDGMFEFRDLTSGDYSITVSKAGYTDLIDDYVITVKDKMMRRDVQLKNLPEIYGYVIDVDSGEYVEGVNVQLVTIGYEGGINIERTDSNGYYKFTKLVPGTRFRIDVDATANGFEYYMSSDIILGDDSIRHDINLYRKDY